MRIRNYLFITVLLMEIMDQTDQIDEMDQTDEIDEIDEIDQIDEKGHSSVSVPHDLKVDQGPTVSSVLENTVVHPE